MGGEGEIEAYVLGWDGSILGFRAVVLATVSGEVIVRI